MRGKFAILLNAGAVCIIFCTVAAFGQQPKREAHSIPLVCVSGDCLLLAGVPQTAGMRSGFLRLAPGRTVGRHSTGKNEETLVILHGQGDALLDGSEKVSFTAPAVIYIPPKTHHDVLNTGKEPLEYVYVVAPVATQ